MGKNNLIGQKKGMLTILEKKVENNRTYYYCLCECGNKKWIRHDSIMSSGQKSCGCLSKKTQFKVRDITNTRFNKLVAIRPTKNRDKYNNSVIWEFKCDCGNTVLLSLHKVQMSRAKSCGCLKKSNINKAIKANINKNIINNTNLKAISRKKVIASNKSGVTGVCWNNKKNKWAAQIEFQKKHYNLGVYSKIEDAIAIRKKAEEKLFEGFLEWYKKEIDKSSKKD